MIGLIGNTYVRQVLRMYGVGSKLLNEIKSMYVSILECVRVKGGDSECFMIGSGVRQGFSCPFGSSICIWVQ